MVSWLVVMWFSSEVFYVVAVQRANSVSAAYLQLKVLYEQGWVTKW